MSRLWTVLLSMMLAVLPGVALAAGPQTGDPGDGGLVQQLMALEPYVQVSIHEGITVQTLDDESAIEAGFGEAAIRLARQMIDYQNALMRAAHNQTDASSVVVAVEDFPEVKAFFDLMNSRATPVVPPASTSGDAGNAFAQAEPEAIVVNACGDWDHPVPSSTPMRYHYSSSSPASTLLNQGFHRTSSYACGFNNCSNYDFTKGRSYNGPYGTCSSPRFRDQGYITGSTQYWKQFGEPNPEILSYVWPYWNWGAYVMWWHGRY